MKRNILRLGGPILGLAMVLGGCRPPMEADLSPDGTRMVVATVEGLSLRRADGKGRATRVFRREAQAPEWSPDGKYVVFDSEGQTILLDANTQKTSPLPVLMHSPYVWRTDGKEFVGVRMKGLRYEPVVIEVPSRRVVRTYPTVKDVSRMLWIPGSQTLAVATSEGIILLRGNDARIIERKRDVVALEYQRGQQRIVWANLNTLGGDVAKLTLDISAYDPKTGTISRLARARPMRGLVAGSPRLFLPLDMDLSPRGDRLAVAGLVDASPQGVVDEYLPLVRRWTASVREGTDLSKRESDRMRALERRLRARATVLVMGLDGTGVKVALQRPTSGGKDTPLNPVRARWSTRGDRLCVVYDKQAVLVRPPAVP